jgi:hypothetical protein
MKKILFCLAAGLAISACKPCQAEEFTYGVHLGTYHLNREKDFKEFNPGVYISTKDFTIGAYENSRARGVVYAGANAKFLGQIDCLVGLMFSEYKLGEPMIVFSYRVPNTPFRLSYLPSKPKAGYDTQALHLSMEF